MRTPAQANTPRQQQDTNTVLLAAVDSVVAQHGAAVGLDLDAGERVARNVVVLQQTLAMLQEEHPALLPVSNHCAQAHHRTHQLSV